MDHDEEPPTSLDTEKVAANTQANATISDSYREIKEQIAQGSSFHAPTPARPYEDVMEDAEKHSEFNKKRNRHYGNEAQALKQAAAMDDDEDND